MSGARPPHRSRLLRLLHWIGGHERATLMAIGLISAALWAFASVADEVFEGATASFDQRVMLSLRVAGHPADPLGPAWFEELARDVTALGSVGVLSFVTLAVVGYLLVRGVRRQALEVAVAVGGGLAASQLLKGVFDRPRPELVPHETVVYSSSFPSGHAMMAAVVYLTLAALLAQTQPRRRLKAYLLIVATFVTLAVGASRVYLGVHWPTDVLAGWTAGAAWAVASWWVMRLRPDRTPA